MSVGSLVMPVPVPVIVAAGMVRIGADALHVVVVWPTWGAPRSPSWPTICSRYLQSWQFIRLSPSGNLGDAREEGVHHQRVVVEIGGLAEGDAGMGAGGGVHRVVDATHQPRL